MATDEMSVRLHLKRLRVTRVLVDEIDRLEVEVVDTREVVRCPFCGYRTSRVHETRRVLVKDLPLGRPTTLVWLQRRFECENCGNRHTEDHPEFEGKATRRLARSLVRDARYLTIWELSRRHGLSWHFIMGLVRAWSERVGQQRRESRCRVLLVDETVRHEALFDRVEVKGLHRWWAVAAAHWKLGAARPSRRRKGREAALTKAATGRNHRTVRVLPA